MGIENWRRRTIEPKPSAGERLIGAAKEMRQSTKGAKRGPKPVADPTVVMTFRLRKSKAAALKPGWRKRVAEFLERDGVS